MNGRLRGGLSLGLRGFGGVVANVGSEGTVPPISCRYVMKLG